MGRFPSGQREQTVNLPLLASVVRIHPCPPYLREWRNWQTRMIQVHVYVRTCRFKSCFPHHGTLDFSRVLLLFGGLPPQPHPNGPDIGVGLYAMGHGWVKFSIIVHRFTTRR